MAVGPEIDPASPLRFAINAAAGSSDAGTKREVFETGPRVAGRRGKLRITRAAVMARVAREVATKVEYLARLLEGAGPARRADAHAGVVQPAGGGLSRRSSFPKLDSRKFCFFL